MPSDDSLRATTSPVLAIVNARVWTNDPRRPWAEALLVRNGSVLAIGSSAELRKRAGPGARIVDARGLLVRAAHDAHALASGGPACLEIVEGATADAPATSGIAVMEIVGGEILRDRDGLAG